MQANPFDPRRAPRRGSTPLCQHRTQKSPASRAFLLMLAERTGLEPATPGVTGRYSNQLNYHSNQFLREQELKNCVAAATRKKPGVWAVFRILAERTGLEPATPGVTGRYSNQLNYRSRSSTSIAWWALRGSNSRPNPCKGSALPTELSARLTVFCSSDACHCV